MRIIPENCTTILTTTFEEISLWPWKCQISFKIPNIIVDVGIVEFCKEAVKGGGGGGGRLIIKDFVH